MTNGGKDKHGGTRRQGTWHVWATCFAVFRLTATKDMMSRCLRLCVCVCVCLVTGTTMAARQDCLCQHTYTNTHARIHTLKHSPRVNCNVVKRSGLSDFIKRFKRGRLQAHTHTGTDTHVCVALDKPAAVLTAFVCPCNLRRHNSRAK